jgi:hypothetical protein
MNSKFAMVILGAALIIPAASFAQSTGDSASDRDNSVTQSNQSNQGSTIERLLHDGNMPGGVGG